jgi:cytidine deaminase
MPVYRAGFNAKAGTNSANKIIANLWSATRKCRIREVACFIQTVQTTAPCLHCSARQRVALRRRRWRHPRRSG